MIDEAREELIDLSIYIDPRRLAVASVTTWSTAASLTVGFYAVPITLDVKGLVWYPAPEFEQAGYTVPTTWSELIALSERIVADGRTPWCMGWENGATSGSPGTDWIEGLLLLAVSASTTAGRATRSPDDPTVAAAALDEVAFGNNSSSAAPARSPRRQREAPPTRCSPRCATPVSGQRVAGPSATGRQARRRHVILPAPAATSRECCSALRRRHVRSGLRTDPLFFELMR